MACFQAFVTLLAMLFELAAAVAGGSGPWVGILGVPAHVSCDSLPLHKSLPGQFPEGVSCFSNVYAKWIEAAGARAVGIPYDALDLNSTALDEVLGSIDGVIFTGGGLDLSNPTAPYFRTGSYIFEWVKRQNDQGKYFPLHGHCMGFQYLAILAAGGNSSVLLDGAFDSEDLALPLEWTDSANASQWVRRMPKGIHTILGNEPSTTNLHHDGVTPLTFDTNPLLPGFFNVVSTNHDRKGREFISTMEAKKYPILAVQWHPERNQFEWTPDLNINHSVDAVAVNSWTARDFVGEAWHRIQALGSTSRVRNWEMLRNLTTYAMKQTVADGDILNGLTYMLFQGFGSGSSDSGKVLV